MRVQDSLSTQLFEIFMFSHIICYQCFFVEFLTKKISEFYLGNDDVGYLYWISSQIALISLILYRKLEVVNSQWN